MRPSASSDSIVSPVSAIAVPPVGEQCAGQATATRGGRHPVPNSRTRWAPSPAGSVSAEPSDTRLRCRRAARSATWARASHSARAVATRSSRPRSRSHVGLRGVGAQREPGAGGGVHEELDGHVGGDVLRARGVERRGPALVGPEGAQPAGLAAGRELRAAGGVVDEEHTPALQERSRAVEPSRPPRRARGGGCRRGPRPQPRDRPPRPGAPRPAARSRRSARRRGRPGSRSNRRRCARPGGRAGCRAARWRAPPRRRGSRGGRRAR